VTNYRANAGVRHVELALVCLNERDEFLRSLPESLFLRNQQRIVATCPIGRKSLEVFWT